MFSIIKKAFISTLAFFNHNILLTNSLKYYSLDNQECKIRPEIISVNNKEPIFIPTKLKLTGVWVVVTLLMIHTLKHVLQMILKILVCLKVFNLLAQNNATTNIEKHKSCGFKLNKDACNNEQIWNKDNCQCECEKINTKEVCDSRFIWNPSVCTCECNKYCDIYEYLDHENCICRRKMAKSLTEKCEKILMKLWILFHQVIIIINHLTLVL